MAASPVSGWFASWTMEALTRCDLSKSPDARQRNRLSGQPRFAFGEMAAELCHFERLARVSSCCSAFAASLNSAARLKDQLNCHGSLRDLFEDNRGRAQVGPTSRSQDGD